MKTYIARPKDLNKEWILLDAEDVVLGKLAVEAAKALRGKNKPEFTYNIDTGDHVIVINAEKVKITGAKEKDKFYHRHTGYIGNLKSISYGDLKLKKPELLIEIAVRRMLPKGSLGRSMFRKLRVYKGAHHPHEVQSPRKVEVKVG